MQLRNRKIGPSFSKRIRTFAATLLLFLYVLGNVQVESFHQVFHSLEKALHSSEQEKDPCHRAIYHDEKENGCDHDTHLTAVKTCPMCHVVPFNDQYFIVATSRVSPVISDTVAEHFVSGEQIIFSLSLPSRAPPIG